MRSLFISLLLLTGAFGAHAQEPAATSTEEVSEETTYAETIEIDSGFLYYTTSTDVGGALAASAHDTDGDGQLDVWFTYVDGVAASEAHDTDGDGQPDLTLTLAADETVTAMEGSGAAAFTPPPAQQFVPPADAAPAVPQDLVGDMRDITIAEENKAWMFFLILFVVAAALYFFWKRQQ